jgi:predicted esterase
VGRKRFGWGPARRALKAAESALEEARRRTGLTKVPVMLVGVGRGGVLAFNVAMRKPGTFAGVGSIGGAFSPEGEGQNREAIKAGLRGTRLFIGVVDGADQSLVSAIRKSRDGLRYLGLQVSYSEWPGKGPMFPDDTKKAVRELLDAVSGQNPG